MDSPGSTAPLAFVSLTGDPPKGFEPPYTLAQQADAQRQQPGQQQPPQDQQPPAAQRKAAQPQAGEPQPRKQPMGPAQFAQHPAAAAFTSIEKGSAQRAQSLEKTNPAGSDAWRVLALIMVGLSRYARYIAEGHPYTADDVRAAFQVLALAFSDNSKAQTEPNYLQILSYIDGREVSMRDASEEITVLRMGRAVALWAVMSSAVEVDTTALESYRLRHLVDGGCLTEGTDGSLAILTEEQVAARADNLARGARLRTILSSEVSVLCQHLAAQIAQQAQPEPAAQGTPMANGARAAAAGHPALR